MKHVLHASAAVLVALCTIAAHPHARSATAEAQQAPIRVKDLGKLQGWRDNTLVGYGIVTGLAGTGDSPGNRTTRQALANVFAQFNLTVPAEQIQSRNTAVVMVSAALPSFAREGDGLDITVSSAGDARSLVGGSLLLTPLKGPDGRVHALAQGPLSVGGYRYDSNGNVVQKNHPTVGSVPGGAVVEIPASAQQAAPQQSITFVLADPDYTTASRVASAINSQFGQDIAQARDASGIDIAVPEASRAQVVGFIARIENVAVQPDRRAKVVINERTGTVVAGGDVSIARVAISHGDLKISIASQNTVSQPSFVAGAGTGVRTAAVRNTRVDVDEPNGPGYLASGTTVADLVQSLARLKTSTRDVISILRAIKAAGALHAELVVQ
ncbi:flagellar basal body P-ring protein FlgI [Caenimonas koreensis DSM 17982]|uniref:Flagellar P-ring protein n=1 Tax=Caenimonas koreensis DSM 17982 TaxID=1121255 RepID=A0A844AW01_9BURK|nr:flagellar basal body P-ring protein FlgI [Caenimonas koreensis]MRD48690.1 flagellar basal body P-ring protein FlgI [Caenimonas koreensis DSM 17982]